MSGLQEAACDYLRLRRGLGVKLKHQGRHLKNFLVFMEQRKAPYITGPLALEWAMQSSGQPSSWAQRLMAVRGFARYMQSIDPRTDVPPTGILRSGGRAKPHLYTEEEVCQLISAAAALPPETGLKRWTYSCLFGLLAVTGLRISEALNLKREHVDLQNGLLTIHGTKFGKSRLIPLHPSTQEMLLRYSRRRDEHLKSTSSPYFLVAERGGKINANHIYPVFHRLSREIGIREPQSRTGPRLHDFRHRFGSETILRWYKTGENIEARLPSLSTYLGHSNVRDTYWYISACPELLQQAALRLEERSEARS